MGVHEPAHFGLVVTAPVRTAGVTFAPAGQLIVVERHPDAGGVAQSYGQLVRLGVIENFFGATPKTFNPGDTCQGGSNVPE